MKTINGKGREIYNNSIESLDFEVYKAIRVEFKSSR